MTTDKTAKSSATDSPSSVLAATKELAADEDMARGFLITFEGIDFSGKSVQATLLRDALVDLDFPVLLLREPGGTEISEKIRQVLLDTRHALMYKKTELLLYSAARAQIVSERIAPSLNQGISQQRGLHRFSRKNHGSVRPVRRRTEKKNNTKCSF